MTMLSGRIETALDNFRGNELIILPSDGEFGFQEYFDRKTENLMKRRKMHSLPEENQLLLSYPPRDAGDVIFLKFFESPDIKARGGNFSGCFAVDVTDYLDYQDDEHFLALLDYIAHHRNIHFMLLLFSDDRKKTTAFQRKLIRRGVFDTVRFSYPSAEDLALYILSNFHDYHSAEMDMGLLDHVSGLLADKTVEYDYADSVVNELINSGCSLETEELEKMLTEIILREPEQKSPFIFGFTVNNREKR